ncbi:hypothetical protein ATCVMO0605SPH_327R [Acanthocystis turfacea Chlorella virus MO0605SPH]|nr:hypothetical protein ATCVMO0605SPH_327R [Acanthocystis turfacea Chlorella virus MO0605SPH]AGE60060.1 hypothetical protein ATCVWI0606_343R [Acanthocystis turfacea Chlorella virus WI0606]
MASHNNIVEESPGPLSNRFKQIKAKLGWETKEDPVQEDIPETLVEDTADVASPEVEEAPEESIIEAKEDDEETTEVQESEEEAKEPEHEEEVEPVEEPAEEPAEPAEEPEETADAVHEEDAEDAEFSEDEIQDTDLVSSVDDDDTSTVGDIQTSPEEVSFFEDVEPVAKGFSELAKENGMYTVKFAPIYIETPVVILEEYQRRSALLRLPKKFCDFVSSVEKSVGEAAKENREKWFKAPLDDDDIAQGLKSFLNENILKVKVDEDFALFDETETCVDDIKTPVKVRCILKTSEISFGKSEFGTIFTLKQAQLVKTPKCKISKPKKPTQISYFE